jgi:SAM-dependent methyltransferase
MLPDRVRKYLQVNHLVSLLEPMLRDLVRDEPVVRVVDVGCGSSHLTLLLGWCFANRWRHPAEILGVDRNPEVIAASVERADRAQLEGTVRFLASPIADLDLGAAWRTAFGAVPPDPVVHALVALHACDTATDDALALGVCAGARLIAAAPCCQAELARLVADRPVGAPLAPVLASPHLRREVCASLTDALRTLLLRTAGYRTTAMEFVPAEHTPKNTLIRAVRDGPPDPGSLSGYHALVAALGGAEIRLATLLARPAVPGT